MPRVVRTICPICAYHMLDVTVDGDRIVDVAPAPIPENKGDNTRTCVKSTQALPWSYRDDPKRVKYPMMRQSRGGPWQRVSWDAALDAVAARLTELRRSYGPQALGIEFGSSYIVSNIVGWHELAQFAAVFGTPNAGGYAENCYVPRAVCNFISFGGFLTADLDPRAAPASIFVWGVNPSASLPPLAARILRFKKKNGTRLVVVDPRRTPLAKAADIHLQLRPGTDTALALGMISAIIEEGIYDAEFVGKYTSGFDRLVEHVRKYRPEFVADIVGVPASLIREAARVFAGPKPAAVLRLLGGLETASNSFEAHRAVDILASITGNVDNEGGNIIPEPHTGWLTTTGFKWLGPATIGFDYHPVFTRISHCAITSCFADSILNADPYPLRGMIIAGANPALMHANSTRIREAFKKLEFVVMIDIRFNETSEYADIFLPAEALMEKQELGTFLSGFDNDMLGVIERVLTPPGECLPDYEIWWRLGQKLGFEVPGSFEVAADAILKPIGLSLKDLREKPYYYRKEFGKHEKRGFHTPSGKIEIYSTYLEKSGFPPLPTYVEPPESPVSLPSLAVKYPLIAIDYRVAHYFHTRFRDLPALRRLSPEPQVEINPKDAAKYGIADGDPVVMESLRGAIEVKAKLTDDIKPGVVGVETGWGDPANFNFLTGDDVHQRDPVTGGAMLRAFLCRVRKKGAP